MIMEPSFFRKMDCVIAHKETKAMCSKSMKNSFGKSGFTLIELLVVISIIAVLLSILMPALNKVKEQTRRTICKSNLHQLAICAIGYAVDHDDKLAKREGMASDSPHHLYVSGSSPLGRRRNSI